MDQLPDGVSISTVSKVNAADISAGDRVDGYRLTGVRINRGRAWRQWSLPIATLRLDRRVEK